MKRKYKDGWKNLHSTIIRYKLDLFHVKEMIKYDLHSTIIRYKPGKWVYEGKCIGLFTFHDN